MNNDGIDQTWANILRTDVPHPADVQTARRIRTLLASAAVIAADTLECPSEKAIIAVFQALLYPMELSEDQALPDHTLWH